MSCGEGSEWDWGWVNTTTFFCLAHLLFQTLCTKLLSQVKKKVHCTKFHPYILRVSCTQIAHTCVLSPLLAFTAKKRKSAMRKPVICKTCSVATKKWWQDCNGTTTAVVEVELENCLLWRNLSLRPQFSWGRKRATLGFHESLPALSREN